MTPTIHGLHHNAWRCSDSAATRRFYEDFLGLPLVHAFEISETKTGRPTRALHTFYRMGDGSCLAFFEVPGMPFEFKPQHDFDLHIALEVDESALAPTIDRARAAGIEVRGIADHGFIRSAYFRDPDGYVVELAAVVPGHGQADAGAHETARAALERWQTAKRAAAGSPGGSNAYEATW